MRPLDRLPSVLIVEDEAIISLDIKRLLTTSGFAVSAVAASAEQAFHAIEKNRPDIVLMDIRIHGSADGIETACQIRRRFRLPVVFVTAHADKTTLDRARAAYPFGFIVKPISALSLTSTVEMALHRHRMERELEDHRAWLGTVLQSIPGAVFVADLAGRVQFLNGAAENLVCVLQSDAVGKPLDSVLALSCRDQSNLASSLLDKAEWGSRVLLPKDTLLWSASAKSGLPVEGEVVVSYSGDEPAGAIFVLRDVSRRVQEESILRQEERMRSLGHLASNIARDFSSLHSLLAATGSELSALADGLAGRQRSVLLDKTGAISRINSIGRLIADQLLALDTPPSIRATLVSASGIVASVQPLFDKLCNSSLQVDIHLTDEPVLVLCYPDRLSALLVNVFLNARERMSGAGRIRISTVRQAGKFAGIVFDLEQMGMAAWKPLSFPLEMENPDFSLAIAQALAVAMEGSISFKPLSDTQGRIEILLPLQHASREFTDLLNRRGTVLLAGGDLAFFSQLEEVLEPLHFAVVRCSTVAEALLMGQLCENNVDCVVAHSSDPAFQKLRAFFSSRNPAVKFVCLDDEPAQLDAVLSSLGVASAGAAAGGI